MTTHHGHRSSDTLFLTGGTGFFGRSVLRYLMKLEGECRNPFSAVTVFTRNPGAFLEKYPEFSGLPWLDFFGGDILGGLEDFPAGRSYTHLVHAAADSTLGPRMDAIERFDQIVQGTRNVLDFAVMNGVSRLLFTSSGGVYGALPEGMSRVPESFTGMPDPMNSANAYGVAKRTSEHLCALYGSQHRIEVVVARCFAFVGPDLPLDVHFAIGNFIRDALTRPEITVKGNGTPLRSYLYQDDLAEWLLTMLLNGKPLTAYNLGSDATVSIAEVASLVRDLVSPDKPVRFLKQDGSDEKSRSVYVPDIGLAGKELGLSVNISLQDAIVRTVNEINRRSVSHG
jgi:UDP-glucuronate decarboxylase